MARQAREYSSPIANGYLFQPPDLLFGITDIGPRIKRPSDYI